MIAKTHPENEQRLEVLRSFDVLDSGTEKIYDDITQLTADICEVPLCLISLVEEDRQWFKSEVGLGICETNIEKSVCSHAILKDDYLEIKDTHLDERTVDNPLCQGPKPIRFYAGAVLRSFGGWPLGTLCVLDFKPRVLTQLQKRVLRVHANNIMQQLELTRALVSQAKQITQGQNVSHPVQNQKDVYHKVQSRFETLTPREKEVVDLMVHHSGSLSSKELARELGISPRTIDHHRASIMTKMDVDSVAELIIIGFKAGVFQ